MKLIRWFIAIGLKILCQCIWSDQAALGSIHIYKVTNSNGCGVLLSLIVFIRRLKMQLTIRSVTIEDQDEILDLWGACGLVVPWNDPKKDFERKITHSPEQFLVAEREGAIIASTMFGYDGHRGSVNYLVVLPECQKMGIGNRVVSEVERRLGKMGCPKINLQVRNTNVNVIKFYEAAGYKVDPVLCLGKRLIADD